MFSPVLRQLTAGKIWNRRDFSSFRKIRPTVIRSFVILV